MRSESLGGRVWGQSNNYSPPGNSNNAQVNYYSDSPNSPNFSHKKNGALEAPRLTSPCGESLLTALTQVLYREHLRWVQSRVEETLELAGGAVLGLNVNRCEAIVD